MEVYGSGRIELVPAYLLLAEANLGLKRFKVAEEFLLYANWSVLKHPDCSHQLKSHLYRNFGKLYASQGRYAEALKQLANDVYYSSLESGPEHIDTAGGYFYMADVFLTQANAAPPQPPQPQPQPPTTASGSASASASAASLSASASTSSTASAASAASASAADPSFLAPTDSSGLEQALALYDKVVDIWYKFLIKLRRRSEESISDYLSEAHIAEAVEMLKTIRSARHQYLGAQHIAVGRWQFAPGFGLGWV